MPRTLSAPRDRSTANVIIATNAAVPAAEGRLARRILAGTGLVLGSALIAALHGEQHRLERQSQQESLRTLLARFGLASYFRTSRRA